MRISFEWLGDFVDLGDVTPRHAADLLISAGIEVESVTVTDLSEIVVGQVISQEPHPKPTRTPLWVHIVDIGAGGQRTIIAGRPNARPGSLVPVALPGTRVPNGKEVGDRQIAGVPSQGMLCSAEELNMEDGVDGIMVLDAGAPGQSLAEIFPADAILEAEVTSNRPDCLGHLGVARELAALLGRPLKHDFMPAFLGEAEPPGTDLVKVVIEDPRLCRRYIGAVIKGVSVGPSPRWMQRRLRAGGLRPINNVVDVTNYVLLEYGQPTHAFDLQRLGGEVRVRPARAGERLACLDGVVRELTPQMLVIADATRPVAIAGVIGGEDTAVTGSTDDLLLEAANFDGPSVRATSRALGLRTDASSRFEKMLPPELALAGARRAASLLAEVAGGAVHREWPDVYPVPQEPVRVRVLPAHIDALLGVHVPLEESEAILTRLGFQVRVNDDGTWDVMPPVFRLDISIPEDIVEEVGRIHGYDKIPPTLPGASRPAWETHEPSQGRRLDAAREVMAGAGFNETVTPALVALARLERLGLAERSLKAANALSLEFNALRTSLLPSLLEVAARNLSRGGRDLRFFEIASVYLQRPQEPDGQPQEPLRLAAVLSAPGAGPEAGRTAHGELKSVLDRVLDDLDAPPAGYRPARSVGFHPGRCAAVTVGGHAVGHLGELHPLVLAEFDLPGRYAALEVDLEPVLAVAAPRRARPLPRFPAADRDLAVVVVEGCLAADLLASIADAGRPLLQAARPFDEYRGSQLEPGYKSIGFALTFRSSERTLTDAEVDSQIAAVKAQLEHRHGARFRV